MAGLDAILGVVPTLQAAAIAGDASQFIDKPNKTVGDFGKQAVKSIVGIEITKATADLI